MAGKIAKMNKRIERLEGIAMGAGFLLQKLRAKYGDDFGAGMTDTNQKLREALQAISHIDDTTSHTADASAALDRIGSIVRQALALPTADHLPDAGEMVGAELPPLGRLTTEQINEALDALRLGRVALEWSSKHGEVAKVMRAMDTLRAALSAQAVPNPWRDAVIEQLESWHIYVPAIHENSPRLAIKALVNIETQAALDPKVSSQAAALAAGAVPDERDKVVLSIATDALDEIALAGMSGTGQESEEGMRDWHARQAWKFISIAARAKSAIDAAMAARAKGGAA